MLTYTYLPPLEEAVTHLAAARAVAVAAPPLARVAPARLGELALALALQLLGARHGLGQPTAAAGLQPPSVHTSVGGGPHARCSCARQEMSEFRGSFASTPSPTASTRSGCCCCSRAARRWGVDVFLCSFLSWRWRFSLLGVGWCQIVACPRSMRSCSVWTLSSARKYFAETQTSTRSPGAPMLVSCTRVLSPSRRPACSSRRTRPRGSAPHSGAPRTPAASRTSRLRVHVRPD
jgi:hypothetical protein